LDKVNITILFKNVIIKKMKWIYFVLFTIGVLIIFSGGYLTNRSNYNVKNLDSQGENLICFGNSLTVGEGADSGQSYPATLAKKLSFPVINSGGGGDTSYNALQRLQKDVLAKNPFLVIVEFGANDYLKGIPQEETLENIERIIEEIQQAGAAVVLLEVKITFPRDKYISSLKKIAKKKGAFLIPDILKGIHGNPKLMSPDTMHPNGEGYKVLAEKVFKAIEPLLKNKKHIFLN